MGSTILILANQLSLENSALLRIDKRHDRVLLIEAPCANTPLRYHQQRLAFIYSTMRHFAQELKTRGLAVAYCEITTTTNFLQAVKEHITQYHPTQIQLEAPTSYSEQQVIEQLKRDLSIPIILLPSNHFLVSRDAFANWAHGKNHLLMEAHYRLYRKQLDILIDVDGEPTGGRWNFDSENRKTYSDWRKESPHIVPIESTSKIDAITQKAIEDVQSIFNNNPGKAHGIWLPVTREAALNWLDQFLNVRLKYFGPFQDVMVENQPTLFHSILSPMLNLGILSPKECIDAALKKAAKTPSMLSSLEGFVRQILGWREFINGVYWITTPHYETKNELNANRPLPKFFYTGDSDMKCLRTTITQVIKTGYNHHIQRLMILGNFALIAGIQPQAVLKWFNEMYVDAHEWVMAPNVLGMALHADGGFMATKPYAASASYISRMSNYCSGCKYNPKIKSGKDACPFNLLYWDFYDRHQDTFAKNPRTSMMVKSWKARSSQDRTEIKRQAEQFLDAL